MLLDCGALLALLSSISGYAQPGCEVDVKGQADTSVVELAVALLRFMAVQQPSMCRQILKDAGTQALDKLQSSLIDEKLKLEKEIHVHKVVLRNSTDIIRTMTQFYFLSFKEITEAGFDLKSLDTI